MPTTGEFAWGSGSASVVPRQTPDSVCTLSPPVGLGTPIEGSLNPTIPQYGWLEAFGDFGEIDLRQGGADELGLVRLGVPAPLELGDHLLEMLDVLVVERDADDLVMGRLFR